MLHVIPPYTAHWGMWQRPAASGCVHMWRAGQEAVGRWSMHVALPHTPYCKQTSPLPSLCWVGPMPPPSGPCIHTYHQRLCVSVSTSVPRRPPAPEQGGWHLPPL